MLFLSLLFLLLLFYKLRLVLWLEPRLLNCPIGLLSVASQGLLNNCMLVIHYTFKPVESSSDKRCQKWGVFSFY